MNNKKRFSTLKVGGLVLGFGLMMSTLMGCATRGMSVDRQSAAKIARLEARLRQAKLQIETLREHNWVLKNRIKIVQENGGVDPQTEPEPLAAFSGTKLDVPISPTLRAPLAPEPQKVSASMFPAFDSKRQNVALVPRVLPQKNAASNSRTVASLAQAPTEKGEQADTVLVRTVTQLLKSGDEAEANRTAALLEKSYPDSELVAEARFQQGLYYFRRKNLAQADRFFQTTLELPKAHVRARAGAALMRGIIAHRLAVGVPPGTQGSPVAKSNYNLARRSFEYVRKQFPKSPEAKRASRELRSMTAELRVQSSSRIQ
jgi:TolA-binding protein